MIVIDREWLADGEPSPELIWEVLKQFDGERFRLNELKDYYDGEHSISERWRGRGAPNYRLSHDLPGYIVAMTSGYLTGEPIQYTVNGEWTGFQTLLDGSPVRLPAPQRGGQRGQRTCGGRGPLRQGRGNVLRR